MPILNCKNLVVIYVCNILKHSKLHYSNKLFTILMELDLVD